MRYFELKIKKQKAKKLRYFQNLARFIVTYKQGSKKSYRHFYVLGKDQIAKSS